jgi:hypothetical protein
MRETGYAVKDFKEHKIEVLRALLWSCLFTFVMALVMALLIGLTHPQGPTGVLILGLMVFGGFILLPQVHRVLFEKRSWKSCFASLGEYGFMIITGAYFITYLG